MLAVAWVAGIGSAQAQSASMLGPTPSVAAPVTTREVSLVQLPPPTPIRLHDLINIEVDERTNHVANALANRRRSAQYSLTFRDLIVLLSGARIRADQAVRSQQPAVSLQSLYQMQVNAQSNRLDSLQFTLQAEVMEIKPNGNLVVEANGTVAVNNEVLTYKIGGTINPLDVNLLTRSISSEKVASKRVLVTQVGPTRDVMKRGMILRILDMFRVL